MIRGLGRRRLYWHLFAGLTGLIGHHGPPGTTTIDLSNIVMYIYQRLTMDVNDKLGNVYYLILEGTAQRAATVPRVSLLRDLSSQLAVETVKRRGDANKRQDSDTQTRPEWEMSGIPQHCWSPCSVTALEMTTVMISAGSCGLWSSASSTVVCATSHSAASPLRTWAPVRWCHRRIWQVLWFKVPCHPKRSRRLGLFIEGQTYRILAWRIINLALLG